MRRRSAMASGSVEVSVGMEIEIGPKTAAWLVSLGWTPPATGVENLAPVYPTDQQRSAGLRWRAAQMRAALKDQLTEADQIKLDDLLRLFGADLTSLPSPE